MGDAGSAPAYCAYMQCARAASHTGPKGSAGSHVHEFLTEGRDLDLSPSSI